MTIESKQGRPARGKLRLSARRKTLRLGETSAVAVRRDNILQLDVHGRSYYVACDPHNLEIFKFLSDAHTDAVEGTLTGPLWMNPNVEVKRRGVKPTELFALSYFLLKKFLGLCDTRNLWAILPSVPKSMTSYLKDRASFTKLVIPYKVAMISCWERDYTIGDLGAIEQTFVDCGLSKDNSIFYVLAVMAGDMEDFALQHDEPYVLTVSALNKEVDEFSNKSFKLCYYQVHKKLRFIASSHRLDFSDLATELLSNTIVAYRLARPMRSRLHSENYARRALTNTVMRIIHAATTYDHLNQLWQGDDGSFVSRNLSLSSNFESTFGEAGCIHSESLQSSVGFNEDVMLERLEQSR